MALKKPHLQKQRLNASERRSKVVCWMKEGKTQDEMAVLAGVCQQRISQDVAIILKEWREARLKFIDDQKMLIEHQLRDLYRRYAEGWQRSLRPRKQTHTKAVEGTGARREAGQTEEQRIGDPRFLDGQRGIVKDIRDLWGLDAPPSIPVDLAKCTTDQVRLLAAGMSWEMVAQLSPEEAQAIPTPHMLPQPLAEA
jgi:hypothetical protein